MTQRPPVGLQSRGRRMWRDSLAVWQLTPAHLVLLEEACRTADRLDGLDAIIRRVSAGSGGDSEDSVDITGILAEARQQQNALKGILAELRQGSQRVGGSKAGGPGVSDLTARIAERRAQAEG